MVPKYIKKASDLQTQHRAICDGFLSQAIKKTEIADPYVKHAKKFYKALQKTKNIDDLLSLNEFKEELISASGFSDKGKARLTESKLNNSLRTILNKIMTESNREFREEILFRYLLTKGDTLGGSMRNITGASAGVQLVGVILETLKSRGIEANIKLSDTEKVQKISWDNRRLLFDKKPKLIDKSIDIILLDTTNSQYSEAQLLDIRSSYLACGELKGGIDPAGADEHWKTANSALARIRKSFPKRKPSLFFIAAAIESAMAKEIYTQLKKERLTHAANSTKPKQLNDLVEWLVSL